MHLRQTLQNLSFLTFALTLITSSCFADKPNVWVYSDMSDPTDRRYGGHPQTDPDDISAMASLLLSADRYNIVKIVVGSTNRKNLRNPIPFVKDTLLNAYEYDAKILQSKGFDFPSTVDFEWSSITQKYDPDKFDFNTDYSNLSKYPTVKSLIDYAKGNKVFVLSWGPITEAAIAVKHLIDVGDKSTLKNITVVSHWTKSSIAQGGPKTPFKVANCQDDRHACDYMHDIALSNKSVKFIELGSVGQKGIVSGSKNFSKLELFDTSRLGQIFIRAKYYNDTPDQSDASSHWLLLGDFGIGTGDYPTDGSLPIDTERRNTKMFFDAAPKIMQYLQDKTISASSDKTFTQEHLARYFTYVYFKKNRYSIYSPYEGADFEIIEKQSGKTLTKGRLSRGANPLVIKKQNEKFYEVHIKYKSWQKTYWL